jgi:ComF family protein
MAEPSILDLIFPSRCAVCESKGPNLCARCEFVLVSRPHRFSRGIASGLAATRYSPEISKLLVGFKDQGQFSLAGQLGVLMLPLSVEINRLNFMVDLVPVPSRSENFSKRGFVPGVLLAKTLCKNSANSRVMNCLVFKKAVKDQVGLSSLERARNISGSMSTNQRVSGRPVYLVDDVVTTGATIQEAWRTMTLAGAVVLGALVISESQQT